MVATMTCTGGPEFCLVVRRRVGWGGEDSIIRFALTGNITGVKSLLDVGQASMTDVDPNHGRTALHYAVLHGHVETCRLLLQWNADPYAQDDYGTSPYQIAWEQYFTKYGGTDTLQALHLLFTKTPTSETWNFTHLHEVVLCILPLDLEETLQDCRYRSQINVRDSKGRTPLHWAAVRGDENAITLLLDHGAKINAQDEKQATPLLLAASSGTDRTLKLLILAGANVHLTDIRGGHALHYAARYQRETAPVKVLLQAGSPVDCRNIYGDTPFIAAAAKNNYEIGAYLLQKGADMHASNNLNDTPLFQSIYQNSHEFLELLLRKGVRYTSVNKSGSTILHAAALEADLLTISILSTSRLQGLCSSVLDKNGNTPLEIAKRRIAYPEGFQEAFEHLSSMLK